MFLHKIHELQRQGLLRSIIDRDLSRGSMMVIKGRELVNFASNDYLGLSAHPEIIDAAKCAMEEFGLGCGASRLLAGGSALHRKVEESIACFKGAEAALLFNSGYAANTGVIPSISSEQDIIFSDELNHASIIDGCRLSSSETIIYRHRDTAHLAELMERESARLPGKGGGKYIVATDSVFSMDGDIAPMKELYELCKKYRALLYIDDAHGTGVIGKGRGILAHFGIKPEPWIIQMGTFSKALGSYGAFVAGTRELIDWLINSARSFMFSTALPACVVAASIKAIDLIENRHDSFQRLWINHGRLIKALSAMGCVGSETPIIPVKIGGVEKTLAASKYLREKGLYVPAIRPPTVKEPRLRITITASHTGEDIDRLVEGLRETLKKAGR